MVDIFEYPTLIRHLGNGFIAIFETPAVPDHLFDRAMDNKY